jgi:hypothetical protein
LPLVSHRPNANGSAATRELSDRYDQQVCKPSLPGRCNDSRVHLMRILAQHRAHGGARPPCSWISNRHDTSCRC